MKHKILLIISLILPVAITAQSLIVEKTDGPITPKELKAFKDYIKNYNPDSEQIVKNMWVFGDAGKAIEACGLMFEATKDTAILNRMIFYADRSLAWRNDLAPISVGGQKKTWTGNIDPVWPSSIDEPIGAGIEQGSVLAHMAFCAKLILQSPTLWHKEVNIGDPNSFGKTYKERALKYIKEANYVMDNWIIPRFVRKEDNNRIYFPGAPNTYKPLGPAPWNQLFMVTNGLVRLTECHVLLEDDKSRVKKYDAIVKPNLEWFFSTLTPKVSKAGTLIYEWDYALDQRKEDANHFAYDAEGLWIALNSGRYGLQFNDLVPFANTYIDVILAIVQPNGKYAGMVDGTSRTGNSGGYNFVRDEYFYLVDYRPDQFERMVEINRKADKIAQFLPAIARLLWQKKP
jgi:hypothetical protein